VDHWLAKYPHAAALLQSAEEELLYDADGDASLLHQAGYAYVVADIQHEYERAMAVNREAAARACESQHAFEQYSQDYERALARNRPDWHVRMKKLRGNTSSRHRAP
jgi:hypothetical protein